MRLKPKDIPVVRASILEAQQGLCAICSRVPSIPCLDHEHLRGFVRGVLCSTCNVCEAKVLNALKRFGVPRDAFLIGLLAYVHKHETDTTNLIHPSFKSPAEKKLLASKRRKRKAKALAARKTPK